MDRKIKVLFVCLGNICRSPAAEAAFRLLVNQANLSDRFEIDSAGTGSWHEGELADPRMRKTAKKHGIEMTHHARQIKKKDLEYYDYIFVMDGKNYFDVKHIANNQTEKNKIIKLRRFDDSVENEPDVPDPYYGDIRGFEEVWSIVSRSGKGVLEWIMQNSPECFQK